MHETNITGSRFSQFSQSLTQTAGTMQITAQPQTHPLTITSETAAPTEGARPSEADPDR